jgi:L-aspartate oxidase
VLLDHLPFRIGRRMSAASGSRRPSRLQGANRLAANSLPNFVFGRRAGLAPCGNPRPPAASIASVEVHTSMPAEQTRAALWRYAGLQRDAAGLVSLLDNPSPLARLIAASCLVRE